MLSLKEIKDSAKHAFKSRYWVSVGLLGIISLVLYLCQITIKYLTIFDLRGFIVGIAFVFAGTVLWLGSLNVGMGLANGSSLNLKSVFSPFKKYGRNLGGSLWYFLFIFLWVLAVIIIAYAMYLIASTLVFAFVALSQYNMQFFSSTVFPLFLNMSTLITIVLLVFVAAIVIIKALQFFCARYILLEYPNVSPAKILNLSKTIMKGNLKKLFGLVFSILWFWIILLILTVILSSESLMLYFTRANHILTANLNTSGAILSIVTLIVYVLYYSPYSQAAFGIFYFEVKAKALADGRITYADLGEVPPIAPVEQEYIESN